MPVEGQSCVRPVDKLSCVNIRSCLGLYTGSSLSKDSNRHSTEALQEMHTHLNVWPVPQQQSRLSLSSLQQPGAPLEVKRGHITGQEPIWQDLGLACWVPLQPQGPSGKGSLSHPGLEKQKAPGWPEWPFPGLPTTFFGEHVQSSVCPKSLYAIRTSP